MILESVQRWLNAHCQGREDIVGAVVVRVDAQQSASSEPALVRLVLKVLPEAMIVPWLVILPPTPGNGPIVLPFVFSVVAAPTVVAPVTLSKPQPCPTGYESERGP